MMTLSALPWIALFALDAAPQEEGALPQVVQQARTPIPAVQEPPVLCVYDVRDLVEPEPATPVEVDPAAVKERDERLRAETEALAAFLSSYVEPPLAKEAGETLLAAAPGSLIAMARPAQQAWLERVLDLHRADLGVLSIRVRYVQGARGAFDEYGKDGTVSFLENAAQLEAFERLAAGPGMELVSAPQLLAPNLMRCTIEILQEVAYVKEYRLIVVEPRGEEIADPIVDVVREGYSFNVRAAKLGDGLRAIALELTRAQIQRPIPTRRVRLSPALPNEVEISTPVCLTSTIESKLVVAEGTAVLFLAPSNDEEHDLACLLTIETLAAR